MWEKRKMTWNGFWSSSYSSAAKQNKNKKTLFALPFFSTMSTRTTGEPAQSRAHLAAGESGGGPVTWWRWLWTQCRHFRFERITVLLLLHQLDNFLSSPLWLANGNTTGIINSIYLLDRDFPKKLGWYVFFQSCLFRRRESKASLNRKQIPPAKPFA